MANTDFTLMYSAWKSGWEKPSKTMGDRGSVYLACSQFCYNAPLLKNMHRRSWSKTVI